jgi:probable HAF family extracellular repeat protein
VGYVKNSGGSPIAGLWSGSSFTVLGTLGGASSQTTAISDAGRVVGYSYTADGKMRAFLWQLSTGMQNLGTLNSTYNQSWAEDINDAATPQIVGYSYYFQAKPSPGKYFHRACVWEGGKVYDLNSYLVVTDGSVWVLEEAATVNNRGQIVVTGTRNGVKSTCLLTPK